MGGPQTGGATESYRLPRSGSVQWFLSSSSNEDALRVQLVSQALVLGWGGGMEELLVGAVDAGHLLPRDGDIFNLAGLLKGVLILEPRRIGRDLEA